MTTRTTLRTAALLGVASVSALAVPAVASAHPFVYPSTAKVAVTPATTPPTYTDQVRYVVGNHGFTYLLRESNGLGAGSPSVISWARSEGRSGDAIIASDAARTGAQAHATCDVPALTSTAVIRSWQGDPFYAYVPFQSGAAGLEDRPATWLPVVQQATGVDLTTIPDTDAAREAACEALPGATSSSYAPADVAQSTTASFNSGLITETKAPFQAQVLDLQQSLAATTAARSAADQATAAQKARADAAEAELAQASGTTPAAAPKPLGARLRKRAFTPAAIVSSGVPVAVTGPAGQVLRVRATVSAAQARRHGLHSTVLGSKAGVVGRDGTASITVKPSASQGRKLKAAKGSVPVTLELVVGTAKATVAR